MFSPKLVPLRSLRSNFIDSFSFGNKRKRFWRLFRSVMWRILVPLLPHFSFFSFFLNFFNNYSGWIFIKINNFTTDERKGIFTRCETTIHRSQAFATSIQDATRGMDSHVPRLSTKKLIRCGKNSIFPDSESQIWNLGNCVEHIGKFAQIITTNPQEKKNSQSCQSKTK